MSDPRRKKITPIMPSRVTSTGIVEDKVNDENRGLFQNQMNKNEYWTYDEKLKHVVVMEIPRTGQAKVKQVFENIPYDMWKQIRTCMKEFIIDDKKNDDSNNEETPDDEQSQDQSEEQTPQDQQQSQQDNPPRRRRRRSTNTESVHLREYNGGTDDVSDVYEDTKYGYHFVYNYDKNQLQCIDPHYDYSVGLSRQDWEDNPQYWVDSVGRQVEMDRVYS